MSRELFLSPAAEQVVQEIWIYLWRNSEAAADRFLARIEKRFEELRAYPELGPSREDVQTELRHLVMAPYLIMYRLESGMVVVGRIIDGRRDLSAL